MGQNIRQNKRVEEECNSDKNVGMDEGQYAKR